MRQIFGMRGPVCPFRLLCIPKICAAYASVQPQKKQEPRPAVISPNRLKIRLHIIFTKSTWFPLAGVRQGYWLWLLRCRPSSPFKKKKKSSLAEPQREVLFLAVLRMECVCNIHATSDALSALCGYVYECVCV